MGVLGLEGSIDDSKCSVLSVPLCSKNKSSGLQKSKLITSGKTLIVWSSWYRKKNWLSLVVDYWGHLVPWLGCPESSRVWSEDLVLCHLKAREPHSLSSLKFSTKLPGTYAPQPLSWLTSVQQPRSLYWKALSDCDYISMRYGLALQSSCSTELN